MITEDYVSFEIAKLLKEKGFDEKCRTYYKVFPESRIAAIYHSSENRGVSEDDPNEILCPTLQMVIRWVQEIFNIVIIPDYEYECDSTPWCYKIFKLEENGKPERVAVKGVSYDKDDNPTEHVVGYRDYERSYKDYATKEEACEAAIKYCIEILI